jgi:hypothetical protein
MTGTINEFPFKPDCSARRSPNSAPLYETSDDRPPKGCHSAAQSRNLLPGISPSRSISTCLAKVYNSLDSTTGG